MVQQEVRRVIKTIRRFLGIEKFESPREPLEFHLIRPVIEAHVVSNWSMGKTPENPAIVVDLNGKAVPTLLKQQLQELANYHGFEIEIRCFGTSAREE